MTIIELVLKDIEDAIERRKDALASGHVTDFAEYRHLVGVISGLTSTQTRIKDLLKSQEDE